MRLLLKLVGALAWVAFLWRIGVYAFDGGGVQWDTGRLAADNAALRACFSAGQFRNCEAGGHFPLFQHLIAFFLGYTGAQAFTVVKALTIVSFVAFLRVLVLGWGTLDGRLRYLWLLLIGSSPLLYYAQASFGEMLSAALILSAVAACLTGSRALWVTVLVFFAGITKEIAPPFVFLLCMTALAAIEGNIQLLKRKLRPVGLGCILAIVANGAFNFVRFGVPWNAKLLGPTIASVPLEVRPGFFAGIWFSPNAGLLFFWPAFVALLVYLIVHWPRGRRAIPLVGSLVVLFFLTLGLSGWWSPFGWICWGPRLMLPWIPAVLLILLRGYPDECEAPLRASISWLLLIGVIFAGFEQFSSVTGYSVIHGIFAAAPGCPSIPMHPEKDPAYYFNCMKTYIWEPRISLQALFSSAYVGDSAFFSMTYVLGMGLLGWAGAIPAEENHVR